MTDKWRLIDSGACDAFYNMALDEAISIAVREGKAPPTLRFYKWEKISVSLGSFQNISIINLEYCRSNNIPVVRRPTGGRAILHGDELTYSFSSPNIGVFSTSLLNSYKVISDAFFSAFKKIGIPVTRKMERASGAELTRTPLCFNSASYGEIMSDGKKIIGSAQKRWVNGFLQQGSIPYFVDYEGLKKVFDIDSVIFNFKGIMEILPDLNIDRFKEIIRRSFEEHFHITLIESPLLHYEKDLALYLLQEKYLTFHWNKNRLSKNLSFCNSEKQPRGL
jgi:lipoate-protein ligase A